MKQVDLKQIINTFIDEAMELNDLPGLVIGVSLAGEKYTFARGVRDKVTGDPLQADDVFHCASVSKLFTSSAILKLVASGVLGLEDRLCDILPELFEGDSCIADRRYREVRLWQMLSHTAGIGDVDDYHWEQALTSDTALSEYVHSGEVTDLPLLWAPGEGGFRYSNVAYEILGHIVSVKSAEYAGRQLSYEAFVKEFLMEPAGMADSTMLTFERIGAKAGQPCPLITEEIRRRNAAEDGTAAGQPAGLPGDWHPMALPHEKAEDRSIVPVKFYPYTRSHGPSSTLTSTAADLLRWGEANMPGFAKEGAADAVLPSGIYQHIRQEYAEVPNNREKMGLGWFMRRQLGYQLYGHEGTDDGFRASLWICPEKKLAIAVLSNLSGAPVKRLNKKLFERILADFC